MAIANQREAIFSYDGIEVNKDDLWGQTRAAAATGRPLAGGLQYEARD